jgi:hypothetical protein
MKLSLSIILLSLLAACASDEGSSKTEPSIKGGEEKLLPDFHPPEPAKDDIRIFAPTIHGIEAGRDVTMCTYIANPFGREVDVVQSLGYQSKFGHHAILMEVPGVDAKPGESHECTEQDMNTARYLAGGSDAAQNIKIPEGIAFRISAKANLMVQTHWINTSSSPAEGQTVFNVAARTPDPSRKQAQLFTALTMKINIPARGKASATTDCTIQEDIDLFNFGGHAHEWGTNVKIERIGLNNNVPQPELLYNKEWHPEFQSNPPLDTFEVNKPLSFKKGDVVRVTCDYTNTEDKALSFPREMCVAFGFYFPATKDIQCIDNKWIVP